MIDDKKKGQGDHLAPQFNKEFKMEDLTYREFVDGTKKHLKEVATSYGFTSVAAYLRDLFAKLRVKK